MIIKEEGVDNKGVRWRPRKSWIRRSENEVSTILITKFSKTRKFNLKRGRRLIKRK